MIVHLKNQFELIEKMWPVVAPLLEPAVKRSNGCYETSDVYADIQTGHQELWVDVDENDALKINAAMTTMFDRYPRKKSLKVVFAGGKKMKKWFPEFVELIEGYAKENGVTMLECYGRSGWSKIWPGARINGVGTVKDL